MFKLWILLSALRFVIYFVIFFCTDEKNDREIQKLPSKLLILYSNLLRLEFTKQTVFSELSYP